PLVFEVFDRRAGADQVAVSCCAVDAANGREVLVLLEVVDGERGLLTRVCAVPVRTYDGGSRVGCLAQRRVLNSEIAGGDLLDFGADGDHGFDETGDLHEVLRLCGLHHKGSGNRERQRGSVEAEVDEALGNIFSCNACAGSQFTEVQDAFVGYEPALAGVEHGEVLVEPGSNVVRSQQGGLGGFGEPLAAHELHVSPGNREHTGRTETGGRNRDVIAFGPRSSVTRHERRQVCLGRDRTNTGSATTVRDAERLVQVQVRYVAAELARLREPNECVEVGAIDVDLAAGFGDSVANFPDFGVVHGVRGRVGDHDGREGVPVCFDLGLEVNVIDGAIGSGGHHNNFHTGQHCGSSVGAVRRSRNQAHVALLVAAGQVITADREEAGELTLRTGVRLDGDLIVAGDLSQLGLKIGDQFTPALCLGIRSERMDRGELGPGNGFHLGRGIELHGAGTQRNHGAIQCKVTVRELADVAQELGFG